MQTLPLTFFAIILVTMLSKNISERPLITFLNLQSEINIRLFHYVSVLKVDQILTVLFKTSMAVGCIVALILDNTIPGTIEERGLKAWRKHLSDESDDQFQTASIKIYELPFGLSRISDYKVAKYLPFLPYNDEDRSPAADVELSGADSKL